MRIGTKITLGFVIILVTLLVFSYVSLYYIVQNARELNANLPIATENLQQGFKLEQHILEVRSYREKAKLNLLLYAHTHDARWKRDYWLNTANLQDTLAKMSPLANYPISKLIDSSDQLLQKEATIIQLFDDENTDAGFEQLQNHEYVLLSEQFDQIVGTEFSDNPNSPIQHALVESKNNLLTFNSGLRTAIILTIAFYFILIGIIAIVGYVFWQSISIPLRKLTGSLKPLTEWKPPEKIDPKIIEKRDEIGDLARMFQQIMESLNIEGFSRKKNISKTRTPSEEKE